MNLKRVIYINKEGEKIDIIARIIARKSKIIIIKTDDCDCEVPIPNAAVKSISDPVKDEDEEN